MLYRIEVTHHGNLAEEPIWKDYPATGCTPIGMASIVALCKDLLLSAGYSRVRLSRLPLEEMDWKPICIFEKILNSRNRWSVRRIPWNEV